MATGYSVDRPITGGSFVEIKRNEIERMERVGSGSFGKVYKARWRGRCVAVKDIDTDSEKEVNAFLNELQQLSRVSHENIVILFGACTEMSNCCLVMEYTEYGSLHNLMHNTTIPYTTAQAISWAHQCAEAVDYLHLMKPKSLVHRDLKPLNLLLFNKGEILKICDFGTVRDKATIMTRNTGSIAWMSPEMFDADIAYTEKCDVYSFGIILWEITFRKVPFDNLEWQQIMMAVCSGMRPPINELCPKSIKDLTTKCWDPSPENRHTMKAVIEQLSNVNLDEPLPHSRIIDECNRSDLAAAVQEQPCNSLKEAKNSIKEFSNQSHALRSNDSRNLELELPSSSGSMPSSGLCDKNRGNRKLTKADIAIPTDFKYVKRVGLTPEKGFDLNDKETDHFNYFLQRAGVSEQDLNDKDSRRFIYEFIQCDDVLGLVKNSSDRNIRHAPLPVPPRVRKSTQRPTPPPPPSYIAQKSTKSPSTPPPPSYIAQKSTKSPTPPPLTSYIAQKSTKSPTPPPPPSYIAQKSTKSHTPPPRRSYIAQWFFSLPRN